MFFSRILYSSVGYLYVSGGGSTTSFGERELFFLLLFTCNYVVSVRRGFLFLWVLWMCCFILLWHSLSLPYNYFGVIPTLCYLEYVFHVALVIYC